MVRSVSLAASPTVARVVPTDPGVPPPVLVPAPPAPPAPPLDAFEGQTSRSLRTSVERMLGRIGQHPGKVDGTFSQNTRAALQQLQSARGLDATGYLDRDTLAVLRKVDRERKQGVLQAGVAGERVRRTEARLARLGYDTGNARDGQFDARTAEAVRAFKADEKLKSRSGVLGMGASDRLARTDAEVRHAPYRARVKDTAAHRRADLEVARAVAGDATLAVGASGPAVATVQRHLRSAGYDPRHTDGRFDERTAGMVKQLQRHAGLPVTGEVDARTWKELSKAQMEATSATSPTQRVGERSSAVRRTEAMLKKLGFRPGHADGLYDQRTQGALDRFRKAYHLRGQGFGVTKATLARLEKAADRYVSPGQLTRIMPGLSRDRAEQVAPHLNRAMAEFGIDTPRRQAAFLAQLGHESGSLKYFEELASGAAYEGRTDLGNVRPGDGVRYKGRGPIQLTGRANYRAAGRALGLPLEAHPKMAARLSVGFRTAGWFWRSHGLNGLADQGAFESITRTINGGTNGAESRREYWARARRVLHV